MLIGSRVPIPDKLTPLELANQRHNADLLDVEREVRQIHHPVPEDTGTGPWCVTCTDPATLLPELWPCPTVRVVRKLIRVSRA